MLLLSGTCFYWHFQRSQFMFFDIRTSVNMQVWTKSALWVVIEQWGPVLWAYRSNWSTALSLFCSRRAVAEHQLMHDRGRNIQSLKRLIWLSSAIEGLHTAQTRSAAFSPTKTMNLALNPALVSAAGSPQSSRVKSLLRDFFNPYLIQLPDEEPRS